MASIAKKGCVFEVSRRAGASVRGEDSVESGIAGSAGSGCA